VKSRILPKLSDHEKDLDIGNSLFTCEKLFRDPSFGPLSHKSPGGFDLGGRQTTGFPGCAQGGPMNSSRMMTIATSLLLFSSSSPAFPDEPARNPEAVRRPVPAAPKVATQANHTSPSEPARLGQEEWPTWLEALAETQATGRPTVIVVTSLKASRSMSYVQDLRGDRSLAKLRLEGGVEFAELFAEGATEQVSRLRIGSFPTIIAYRRGARGLEAAGRHQGIMAAPQLFGWLQGLGLVPAQEDGGGPAGELGSASNQDRPEKARTSNKDQSLKRAAYDDIYATPQGRMYAPPPQYQAPPSYGPPSQAAPPQMAPPQQQAPNYQILTLPQAAPPQAAPLQAVPVTINVPQQMTVNVPQQALILQQAP